MPNQVIPGVTPIDDLAAQFKRFHQRITSLERASTSGTSGGGGTGDVPSTRRIDTTPPLRGGGDLSANRTHTIDQFSATGSGVVPQSPGGTGTFLRADGTWVVPPGVPTTRALTAGAGLAGGGDLSADRSFDIVAADATITVAPDSIKVNPPAIPLSALGVPLADVPMNNWHITGLADPVNAQDAVNKRTLDAALTGLSWKNPCRAATTGDVATLAPGPAVVDGVTLAAGDRVLVKNQASGFGNGIYTVFGNGNWGRAIDADSQSELLNAAVFVSEGTTNADTAWVMTTDAPITVGTTPLTWTQFAGGVATGVDEVWIGPDDPIVPVPTAELWYDTDAPAPTPGFGIPSGGTAGQVLRKQTATDYDAAWGPAAGVVYGVNHYHGALAASTVLTASGVVMVTIAMPAAVAGTLLDLSLLAYCNQGTVGTGGAFLSFQVNGVTVGPTCVVGDRVQLESYSMRVVNVVAPVGITYNITLVAQKSGAGGAIQLQASNTCLDVVSYRP